MYLGFLNNCCISSEIISLKSAFQTVFPVKWKSDCVFSPLISQVTPSEIEPESLTQSLMLCSHCLADGYYSDLIFCIFHSAGLLLFFKHIKCILAQGPLHLFFSARNSSSFSHSMLSVLFLSLFKYNRGTFPRYPIKYTLASQTSFCSYSLCPFFPSKFLLLLDIILLIYVFMFCLFHQNMNSIRAGTVCCSSQSAWNAVDVQYIFDE